VYNVASGQGVSVRELARAVLARARVTAGIVTDSSLTRTSDIAVLIGSPAKLREHTGWAPTKSYTDIIDDLLHAEAD
jgi:UDP-glucose 4-epimerase